MLPKILERTQDILLTSFYRALKKANTIGSETIGLLGNNGGKIKEVANSSIIIPSFDTARIQEVHITIGHIICEIIEEGL